MSMSALGQKQTYALQQGHVRFTPIATAKADIRDAKDKRALRSGPMAALDWRMQA
jgi:hypothetical protein